ncbi:MAG: efflux RND transporter permease subunit [Planctomycetota bacterium]
MSLVVAFTITAWLAYKVLGRLDRGPRGGEEHEGVEDSRLYRVYAAALRPFLASRAARWGLLGVTVVLFVLSGMLAMDRRVPLKMLPFDDKNELQVVVDLPEGSSLERTQAATAEMSWRLRGMTEVTAVTSYVGEPSPMDFNGLVRHYYMRRAPNLADLRLELIDKGRRAQQSHAIAIRVRQELEPIARRHGATIAVVEYPPGPPVVSTLTVEVYAPVSATPDDLDRAAGLVAGRLRREAGVVDVDSTVERAVPRLRWLLDREKAALNGIGADQVAATLATALGGEDVTVLHTDHEVEPLAVRLRLPKAERAGRDDLERLTVTGAEGRAVPLSELGRFVEERAGTTIHHKNLRRVAYVFAELAGRPPADAILDLQADLDEGARRGLAPGTVAAGDGRPVAARSHLAAGAGIPWRLPDGITLEWAGEGEWKITLDAFRDLGIAFAVACLGIYVLLVHETGSYLMPLILMISIPLTVIGIMPGFWLLNAWTTTPVAGVADPVFFTATAMIGMIALAGIAVRNAILLIEFVHAAQGRGLSLREALLQSGAVRIRAIFLTAGTAMLAAVPITLDPIFSGLAWALIFGLLVSTAFTLVIVPTVYWMVYGRGEEARRRAD